MPDEPLANLAAAVRRRRAGLAAALAYTLLATLLLRHWLVDPGGRRLTEAHVDQFFIENMLANSAHSLRSFTSLLFTTRINAPVGVNLMANTAMIGLGAVLAPITWLFGPAVTLAVIYLLGLAGTATGWYFVFRRHLAVSPLAAFVGAGFCGFAPTMVAQANGHPSVMCQFLVPPIVHAALGLRTTARPVGRGIVLGALIIAQFFVGQETLMYVALGLGVFVLVAVANRPSLARHWRPMLTGVAVAALAAGVVLAYPIYFEFWGPQSYRGVISTRYPDNDVARLFLFPANSLAGGRAEGVRYAINVPEAGPSLGWPLTIWLLAAVAVWRRAWLVRTLGIGAALALWASFGSAVRMFGRPFALPSLWGAAERLPLLREVVASRLAGVAMPFIGALVAIVTDRAVGALRGRAVGLGRHAATLTLAATALALVPIWPTALSATGRTPAPAFLSSGSWKRFVGDGATLVPLPVPDIYHVDVMGWQAAAGMGFAIPGGYFVAPGPNRFGIWPNSTRRTAVTSFRIGYEGKRVELGAVDQEAARADLCHWNADAAYLRDAEANHAGLLEAFTFLLGQGVHVDDVTVWDVRAWSMPGCRSEAAG